MYCGLVIFRNATVEPLDMKWPQWYAWQRRYPRTNVLGDSDLFQQAPWYSGCHPQSDAHPGDGREDVVVRLICQSALTSQKTAISKSCLRLDL